VDEDEEQEALLSPSEEGIAALVSELEEEIEMPEEKDMKMQEQRS
jgi:hypothetical protein